MRDRSKDYARFLEEKEAGRRKGTRMVMLVMLAGALVLFGIVRLSQREAAVPDEVMVNQAGRFSTSIDLVELHEIDGSWVGTVGADWDGDAAAACAAMAERVKKELAAEGTIALYDGEGVLVAECGPGT